MNMKRTFRTFAGYTAALLLCGALLTLVMELWRADLSVPLRSGGDSAFALTLVKSAIENPWFLHNPRLGAPWGLDFHDYPMADTLHYVALKLLALAVADPIRVTNLYFLLSFPLITLTSLLVLRHFRVAWAPAIVVSVLYAFLPYHFERNMCHLFLSAYYLIPPTVMVLLWIHQDRPLLFRRDTVTGKVTLHLGSFETLVALLVCGLVACAGIYYAAFACFFLLVTGLYTACAGQRRYAAVTAGTLIAVIGAGTVANLLPSLLYWRANGPNLETIARQPEHTELFGLKIGHLLLPVPNHRLAPYLPYFRHGESLYGVSLGLVGSLGFCLLLWRLWFVRRQPAAGPRVLDLLSVLNGAGLVLATVGGLGFLVSVLVSPWIRCYYRICIYLGFFALFAVALVLDRLARKARRTWLTTAGFLGLLALVLVGGVLDQTGLASRPPHEELARAFHAEAEFSHRIEAALPAYAMVFQLPYVTFPESGLVNQLWPYDHLGPYLHTQTLRWSFGAYRARPGDRWHRRVSTEPVPQMVQTLALAGFRGLYLDRNGYADAGADLEARLTQVLAARPLVSSDGRRSFFNLTDYQARLKARLSDSAWDAACRRALDLVELNFTWCKGFSVLEEAKDESWRWCEGQGELQIDNPAPGPRRVTLTMAFSTGQAKAANLWIESDLLHERLDVRLRPLTDFQKTLTLPPGRHTIRFRCDAERVDVPSPRVMVFRVHNFRVRSADEEGAMAATVLNHASQASARNSR
jgi:phosphoglycerol transferase